MPFIGKQPSRGLVGTSDIDDNAVTLGKMAHQADGSIITYDTDTSPVLLAPDTSGEVLTTKGAGALPAFDAVSAGLSFISNTDISSAATYDFTGFTAGSYEHYLLVLQNLIPVTDNVHLWGRTSTDATNYDSGSSDYGWYITTQSSEDVDNADAQMSFAGDVDTGGTSFRVGSDDSATADKMGFSTGGGVRKSAADVDGFRILFSSGNIESGTITAYGLANA